MDHGDEERGFLPSQQENVQFQMPVVDNSDQELIITDLEQAPIPSASPPFSRKEFFETKEDSNMDQSEHTLSTTVKTNIQMEEDGLGLILIQNGPYLQIASLVEKSAAERDGKLQSGSNALLPWCVIQPSLLLSPGDTLLKIGHANVLGWTLRELRQLLHNTPIGTVLQIQVYRDFMKLPKRWEAAVNNIPEIRGPEIEEYAAVCMSFLRLSNVSVKDRILRNKVFCKSNCIVNFRTSSCASEEAWTSSEGSDEIVSDHLPCSGGNEEDKVARESNTVCFDEDGICTRTGVTGAPVSSRSVHSETFPNVRAVQSVSFEPSNQPKWISKDWHIVERKTYTFTVGSDIGCDIMIHTDSKEENEMDISSSYVTSSSPYWTMEKHHVGASSGSSSSVSDAFWLDKHAYEYE
nr:PREDICTED: PDZ domain-containing protein 9 [Anolis carolinensis]|eukprot:XP_008122630.1 PREDICTED: PDZ domain-containing protein 9 [Anolis carolinensis]